MRLETAAVALIVVVFALLAGACEVAKWRECRRYHPVWYCAAQGGGK
jgi:hypothetical protein